jgi:hypothetical protein
MSILSVCRDGDTLLQISILFLHVHSVITSIALPAHASLDWQVIQVRPLVLFAALATVN